MTDPLDKAKEVVESLEHPIETAKELYKEFAVPFFVFQGAVDHVTPVALVKAYVESLKAPRKELVLIPNAGHNVRRDNYQPYRDAVAAFLREVLV